MILKSKNLTLRPIRMSDAKDYFECRKDKKLKEALLIVPKNLAEVKKELRGKVSDLKKKKPFGECFAIEVNGKFAGYIELHNLNIKYQEHKGEIGYCIHPKFKGRSICTKAIKILTKYAFKKYKLKRISAMGRVKNKASARVLEKAGYKLEGILRKNKHINNKYLDDFIYAITK